MELRDYLRVIRARIWIIVQAVVIITAAALIFSFTQKPTYQATTEIQIAKVGSDALFSSFPAAYIWNDPDRILQTTMELIRKDPIAEAVIDELNLNSTPKEILGKVEVSQVKQTDIIAITVTDTDPKRARKLADAFAIEYIGWSKQQNVQDITIARKQVYNKLQETKGSIIEIGNRLSKNPDWENLPPELRSEWDISTNLYVNLAQKYEQLRIDEALKGGAATMVDPANIPIFPVKPKPLQNGFLALAVGLVFGTGLAFFFEYLDNTVKNAEDIENLLSEPILGQIPAAHNNGEKRGTLVALTEPNSIVSEAFRTLRTNVQFLNYDQSIKNILVTSPGPKEGKTTTVANLAISLAQASIKVTVLSCDLRKPRLHRLFHLDNSIGLTNVLMGKTEVSEIIQQTALPYLQIVSSGPVPPNPAELLGSQKMKEVMNEIDKKSDICLIDSPPALSITDSAILAPLVDGVLMVTSSSITTREMIKETKGLLEKINSRLLGVILNNAQSSGQYGKYSKYKYHYYHSDDSVGKRQKMIKTVPLIVALSIILLTLAVVDYMLNLGIIKAIF